MARSFSSRRKQAASLYRFNPFVEGLEERKLLTTTTTINVGLPLTNATTAPSKMLGVNLAYWDDQLSTTQTQQMAEAAGLNEYRFPGGSAADDYHFNISSNYGDPVANTVAQFAQFIQAGNGTGVVTVDYGSGSPQEAEAELAYLVGSPTDTTSIGSGLEWNDSTNQWQSVNWQSVGYWAGLRAASPLVNDDGLNFLRIHQAGIFSGITSWEIGNEEYGSWEVDHHGTAGPGGISTGAQHDPATYAGFAGTFAGFIRADQANLPLISIGIDSQDPTGADDNNWTGNVLSAGKASGFIPGFISDHSYMQEPGSESDSFLLNDTVSDPASVLDWNTRYNDYESLLTQTIGTAASNVQVEATEFNSVSYDPGKQTTSLVNGLFIADSLGSLMQSGYSSSYVWDLRNDYDNSNNNASSLYGWRQAGDYGLLGDPNTSSPPATGPYVGYPGYYAEQLVSRIASTGGQAVATSSTGGTMSAYAVKETNGHLGLLVINKSSSATLTDQFNISGFTPGVTAQVWQYGKTQDTAQSQTTDGSSALASSVVTLSLSGNNFSYSFPAYSMTVLDLSPGSTAAAVTLTGTNYLKLDSSTPGQLDDWASASDIGTPTHTYLLSQVSSLTDAGTAGNDILVIDLTNGDPLAATTTGIAFDTTGTTGGTDSVIIDGDKNGDTYSVTGNQMLISGGTGSTLFSGVPVSFASGNGLSINAGAGPDALTTSGSAAVNYIAPAGSTYPAAVLSSLSIGVGSKVVFGSPVASRALLELNSAASINGQLDLQNNDLLIHGGTPAYTAMQSQLVSGFAHGSWAGNGVISSTAAANPSHLTTLGIMLNSNAAVFDGVSGLSTDVLIKYTYFGDTNFDGKVDGSDYSRIDSGLLTQSTGWVNGDLNYDGVVNGSDYTLIDNAFNRQTASLANRVATIKAVPVYPAPMLTSGALADVSPAVGFSADALVLTDQPADLFFKGPRHSRIASIRNINPLLT